ncbi:hypothetical protein [Ruminococcus sp.]|uniref:hypothetical protein n=1 Tax=Ruminococcus sp. TaxID=41978 RepID=UPI0025E11B33|nr:hypothetical protein [Ruminococcus sp.]MBQ8967764.1 hypothetical protein [Ruminococcus sp.]
MNTRYRAKLEKKLAAFVSELEYENCRPIAGGESFVRSKKEFEILEMFSPLFS